MYIPTQAPPHLQNHDELRRWVEEELRRLGSAWAGMETTLDAATGWIAGLDTAWTVYTPTISIPGGAGIATGRYKLFGKCLALSVSATISSGGTSLNLTLPTGMSALFGYLVGREVAATGYTYVGQTSGSGVGFIRYDNAFAVTTGWQIYLSGIVEVV